MDLFGPTLSDQGWFLRKNVVLLVIGPKEASDKGFFCIWLRDLCLIVTFECAISKTGVGQDRLRFEKEQSAALSRRHSLYSSSDGSSAATAPVKARQRTIHVRDITPICTVCTQLKHTWYQVGVSSCLRRCCRVLGCILGAAGVFLGTQNQYIH